MQLVIIGLALVWAVILVGCWLGWQLLRQNGRLLLRLDELERGLDALQSGESAEPAASHANGESPSLVTSAATSRFGNRSLSRSKIKRAGLKAGAPAPGFRLP